MTALVLMLSTACAMAEETGMQFTLTPAVDSRMLMDMMGVMDEEEQEAFSAMLDLVNSADIIVSTGENGIAGTVQLSDKDVADFGIFATEEGGIALTSNLIPSYALYLTPEALADLLGSIEVNITPYLNVGNTQTPLTEADIIALTEIVTPYLNDFGAYFEKLMGKAVVSEDETALSLVLTSYDIADVADMIAARLKGDAKMQELVRTLVEMLNAELPGDAQLDAEMFLAVLPELGAELRKSEAAYMAQFDMFINEDGSTTLQVDMLNQLLITVDVYMDGTMEVVEFMLVTDMAGTGDSWQTVYDAITSGADSENVVLTIAVGMDESEFMLMAEMYIEGTPISAGLLNAAADDKNTTDIFLDVGGENALAVLTLETTAAEAVAMPNLSGLEKIDIMNATDEEMEALLAELAVIGLSTVVVNTHSALPAQMNVLAKLIMEALD